MSAWTAGLCLIPHVETQPSSFLWLTFLQGTGGLFELL